MSEHVICSKRRMYSIEIAMKIAREKEEAHAAFVKQKEEKIYKLQEIQKVEQ